MDTGSSLITSRGGGVHADPHQPEAANAAVSGELQGERVINVVDLETGEVREVREQARPGDAVSQGNAGNGRLRRDGLQPGPVPGPAHPGQRRSLQGGCGRGQQRRRYRYGRCQRRSGGVTGGAETPFPGRKAQGHDQGRTGQGPPTKSRPTTNSRAAGQRHRIRTRLPSAGDSSIKQVPRRCSGYAPRGGGAPKRKGSARRAGPRAARTAAKTRTMSIVIRYERLDDPTGRAATSYPGNDDLVRRLFGGR